MNWYDPIIGVHLDKFHWVWLHIDSLKKIYYSGFNVNRTRFYDIEEAAVVGAKKLLIVIKSPSHKKREV